MFIAVDTNVLIDFANNEGDVIDAIAVIRRRLPKAEFFVTPTVLIELGWGCENGKHVATRKAFVKAADCLLKWGFKPINLIPVGFGVAQAISFKLRQAGIIPHEEENDAEIIAEAALLGCGMLLSSDTHMCDANGNEAFHPLLKECDVDGDKLVIARPRTIVKRFFK